MNFLDMNDYRSEDLLDSDITASAMWLSRLEHVNYIDNPIGLPLDKAFHGLFIPAIPYQMIERFTKTGETVWDCFAGSGTTHHVARRLNRECICNDVTPTQDFIVEANSISYDPGQKVQLIIMHPPYWNIIEYPGDILLSGADTLYEFLCNFERVVNNVVQFLDDDRMLVLVCGNIYAKGEEITLGAICKDIVRDYGFRLRSHIIKDYGETKGGAKNTQRLQRYRMLRGGYNRFYGDNVFILQKHRSSWRDSEQTFWADV